MSDKLSVIISVGRGAGLQPPLPGAYTGHAEYRAWAESQGHDIIEFTDENGGSFDASDIARAIAGRVGNQLLAELWIYFSGHGECSSLQNDYWLLKRDGALPGDVIDVAKTRLLAALLGIPRVIIIGDACRTTGDLQSMAAQAIAVPILPACNVTAFNPSVECLFATQPGSPALEVRDENARAHGIFTTVLMRALRGEVPPVKTRSDNGEELVVRLPELRIYLEEQVPIEAAKRGGRAQRPNIIEGNRRDPYSVVGQIPNLHVRIDTVTEDGTPAQGTRISLTMLTGRDEFTLVAEQPGPTATFSAPSGCIYEATAQGAYHDLCPLSPLPIFRLDSPKEGTFVAFDGPPPAPYGAPAAPSVLLTRVVAENGGLHSKAPGPGVFPVVTYDALNGKMGSGFQRFADGNLVPVPLRTPADDAMRKQVLQTARVQGRRGFETRTGLTLLDLSPNRRPDVAAPRGAVDDVFWEDGNWQIRANYSTAALIQLGDTCLTGAVFQELVGSLRLSPNAAWSVEDLTYAPASNSRYVSDLGLLSAQFSDSPREEIDALQLIAAQCARNGFFEAAIDESVGLAERMRSLKHHNPVFGILAAYAYDQVGQSDQIVDMIKWFFREGQTVPFDLVMLAGLAEGDVQALLAAEHWSHERSDDTKAWVVPTWPMLTQGWSRLSDAHLERFPILKEIRNSLVPGFWSAASGQSATRFFAAVQEGRLQWI